MSLFLQTQGYGEVNKTWLRERGWTRAMIRHFLGDPDRTRERASAPRIGIVRRQDRPECLYSMARVVEAENTEEFREWKRRLDRRRDTADDMRDMLPPREDDGEPIAPSERREQAKWRRILRAEKTRKWGVPYREWENGDPPPEALDAYRALSRRDRAIIRLVHYRGLRQREVARRLRISQQTVSYVVQKFRMGLPKFLFLKHNQRFRG